MKKHLILVLLLMVSVTPVIANTVKQNNYSEELNNTIVNDYVTKRIRVNDEPLPGIGNYANMTDEEYIAAKKQVLKELQSRYAYYNKYYTLKLNDLANSMDRVKNSAGSRATAAQQAILNLHQRNINEMLEQRNQVLGLIQERINKVQNDIAELKK